MLCFLALLFSRIVQSIAQQESTTSTFDITTLDIAAKCNYFDSHHGIQNLRLYYKHEALLGTKTEDKDSTKEPLELNCPIAQVMLKSSNDLKNGFTDVFNAIAYRDETNIFRYIKLTYNVSLFHTNYVDAASAVDNFIQYRPWWRVLKEPFEHNISSDQHHRKELQTVVLQRYPRWEKYLRFLASVQYPIDCHRSPLIVHRMSVVHPGWFSVINQVEPTRNTFPLAIYNHFFPHWDTDDLNHNAFIKYSDCPNGTINQWECAFIPLTNCTMPKFITECSSKDCYDTTKNYNFDTSLITAADETGQLRADLGHKDAKDLYGMGLVKDDSERAKPFTERNEFYYRMPYNRSLPMAQKLPDPTRVIFWYILLCRRNAFYRNRIDRLIYELKEKTILERGVHYKETASCVAAHVRRGDRVMYLTGSNKAINMTEFCHNVTSHPETCMQSDGSLKKCPPQSGVYDFGCGDTGVPFTSYTVLEIIDKAEQLVGPTVRNLVVSTDDPIWLEEQKEEVRIARPEWTILSLAPPVLPPVPPVLPQNTDKDPTPSSLKRSLRHSTIYTKGHSQQSSRTEHNEYYSRYSPYFQYGEHSKQRGYHGHTIDADWHRWLWGEQDGYRYTRSQAGTDSGVYFWAQMELASKCDAIVGHFGSGISVLLYQMMCFENFGVCPPMFNWQLAVDKKMNTL